MHADGEHSNCASTNPLALLPVLARIVAHLDKDGRRKFRALGTLAASGQASVAEGAVPGCCFVGSACRAAANEAVRTIKVMRIYNPPLLSHTYCLRDFMGVQRPPHDPIDC